MDGSETIKRSVSPHNTRELSGSAVDRASKECHSQSASLLDQSMSCPVSSMTHTQCLDERTSPKLNLMAELFESDEEDNSEVESFTLEEEPVLDTSKFLLSAETEGLTLGDTSEIDPESRAKALEALLEAAAVDKHLIDPDLLRKLTSSVSCALDEAAATLAKMRISDAPLSSLTPLSTASAIHKPHEHLQDTSNMEESSAILNEKFNVNEMTEDGESFLSLACSSGRYDLAEQLLKVARVNVEDRGLKDTTPLMEAASCGHVEIIKLLLAHHGEVNAQTSQGNTPLMYACAGGHVEVVRLLLKAGANVEDHNENGHTPLMEAASAGHVEVAKLLVDNGASINTHSNEFKESALTLACYKGHLEMVRFLLEAGADQEHKTDEMHTALMEASMDGHVEVARLLLDSGAQVNMPADSFESPLTLAACGGHVELAMLLLERGANIEEVNDEGYTPLMEAAREGHEEMVALLLSQGADINAQTEETQETALTLACCGGFLDVADFLIKAGADIEAGANTPLMEAAQEGHLDLVRHLISVGANINAKTTSGDTALMYACENGHTDVAELLLSAGANLEHEAEGGRTPLMKAARAGHLCTVQFLINQGANVNKVTSNNDHTPLSLACAGGHLAVVELLLANGADPTHRLKDNSTMLIEASKGGHTTVVQLLIDYPTNLITSPPPVDVPSLTDVPPRVPLHGPQEELSNKIHQPNSNSTSLVSSSQTKTNIQKSLSKKSKEMSNSSAKHELNEGCTHMKSNRSANKVLERSLSDSGPSLFSSEASTFSNVAAAAVDELERVQAQWQQQLLQCYQASLSSTIQTQATSTVPGDINNLASSVPSACLDISKLQKQLKMSESSFQLPSSTAQNTSSQPTSSTSNSSLLNLANATSLNSTSTIAPPLPTPPANRRLRSKSSSKQHLHHASVSVSSKSSSNLTSEDVEKMNQKNTANIEATLEQANAITTAVSQTQNLLQQQQMILSELAQNPATLQFLQAAASNIKIDTALPLLLPRLFDQNNSTQSSGQQTIASQSAQVSSTTDTTSKKLSAKTAKLNKSSKSTNIPSQFQQAASQQQSSVIQQTNQLSQTPPPLSSELSQTLTLKDFYKSQINASSTSTQTDAPSVIQQRTTLSVDSPDTGKTSEVCTSRNDGATSSSTITAISCPDATTLTTSLQCSGGGDVSSLSSDLKTKITTTSDKPAIISSSCENDPVAVSVSSAVSLSTQAKTNFTPITSNIGLTTNILSQAGMEQVSTSSASTQQTSIAPTKVDVTTTTVTTSNSTNNNMTIPSPPPWYPPLDLDSQTDSNHDTALTLACAGGHEDLVTLLLNRGADMEHRDKKGFTPLMLASTAGHANVVEVMLNNGADLEAQSERTKDTALSLACSSGRYEVVEILLSRGANKEHRNVSDYTPLSLAASGGYVNIIKLLLNHGAEINSRTGSKLGISPLMLAAMNGHATTVKLLLDMGSDINAQIETNRNTALTLACFQGRCDVVSLLLDRKANVEHRAKTGLTPLMEAASGGYVEVGRVLLDKGADVNAPPVPSSRDTALTIAADKGHYRFVELLLTRNSAVDVKNKKGNSPLWLACNGGHLDVVQLLVNAGCDIDSQDNRKVSCLMAAFRKGHVKVVKWMVKHVNQFPSDQEMARYIALINDKELLKKCNQCAEIIRQAKDRQAAEANKNATILLEEIDMERSREESRKAAAARRRERKRQKKKEKQEQMKAAKSDEKENKKVDSKANKSKDIKQEDEEDKEDDEDDDDDSDESNEEADDNENSEISDSQKPDKPDVKRQNQNLNQQVKRKEITNIDKNKKATNQNPNPPNVKKKETLVTVTGQQNVKSKKKEIESTENSISALKPNVNSENFNSQVTSSNLNARDQQPNSKSQNSKTSNENKKDNLNADKNNTTIYNELYVEVSKDVNGNSGTTAARSPNFGNKNPTANNKGGANQSGKKTRQGQEREAEWKEVTRKSKKVVVPANAISRVIGRAGCNINTIREISGAHIEVEKQKGQGDRMVIIKGSADATRNAHQLIAALSKETDKDLSEIIKSLGLSRPADENRSTSRSAMTSLSSATGKNMASSGVSKSASTNAISSSGPTNVTTSTTSRPAILPLKTNAPTASVAPFANMTNAWNTKTQTPLKAQANSSLPGTTSTKSTVSYTIATASKGKNTKTTSASNTVTTVTKVVTTTEIKPTAIAMQAQMRPTRAPVAQPFNQVVPGLRVAGPSSANSGKNSYLPNAKQPFSNPTVSVSTSSASDIQKPEKPTSSGGSNGSATTPEYTPFNNLFSKVAQASVWAKDGSHKPNFASVAASGLMTNSGSVTAPVLTNPNPNVLPSTVDQELSIDASKAPGYRGNLHVSPSNASLASTPSSSSVTSNLGPIGTGPRSAPCTPPLISHTSPLTLSNNNKISSTSSGSPTPPPPCQSVSAPPQQQQPQQPLSTMVVNQKTRSFVESQANVFNLNDLQTNGGNLVSISNNANHVNLSLSSNVTNSNTSAVNTFHSSFHQPQTPTSGIGSAAHLNSSLSNTKQTSQQFSLNQGLRVYPPINTTFSQHNPSAAPIQSTATEQSAMFGSNNVQSNLNPNAPDFSARNPAPQNQLNGSPRMSSNLQMPNPGQTPASLVFQDQMRAAILAASCNLQLQTLQNQQAARMQFASGNPTVHPVHHPTPAPQNMPTADFSAPPTPETLRLLHTAINSIPPSSVINAAHNSQFGMIQQQNYLQRQQQQQASQRLQQPVSGLVTKNIDINTDCEERKLPPPIGTERALRKNPFFSPNNVSSSSMNPSDSNQSGIWPFTNSEMPVEANEWMPHLQQSSLQGDSSLSNFHRYNNSEDMQHLDQSYQVGGAYASNQQVPVMNLNGVLPQLSSSLYHSVSSGAVNNSQEADYWSGKNYPLGGGLSGGQQGNVDQKMNWNSWNHHT